MAANIPFVGLLSTHVIAGFDCGHQMINKALANAAIYQQSQRASYHAYIINNKVVAFYSLTNYCIDPKTTAPTPTVSAIPKNWHIPAVYVGALGVDKPAQGRKLLNEIILDVIEKAIRMNDLAGCRAVVLHAADERLVKTYTKFGFELAPGSSDRLMMATMAQIKNAMLANSSSIQKPALPSP